MSRACALVVVVAAVVTAACGVSTQQEVQIGAEQSVQVQQQLPILRDPEVNQYVTSLGNEIARRTSRADLPWQFYVVNTDVANAFALPGGIIYVNRGIIERATQMNELAGVMAHEIEHVVRRHSVKQMEQMQGASVGVALACTLTAVCNNQAAATAINVGGSAVFAKFSRDDERQADEGGFQELLRAGINPEGMMTFFEKLLAEEQKDSGGQSISWFATHPGTQDRVADIRRLLAGVPAAERTSLVSDTPAFQDMKRRLMALPAAPPAR